MNLISNLINTGLIISAILSMLVFIPQIILITKSKNSNGISLGTLYMSLIIQIFGMIDVMYRQSWLHVLVYGISLIGCLICLILALRYRELGD